MNDEFCADCLTLAHCLVVTFISTPFRVLDAYLPLTQEVLAMLLLASMYPGDWLVRWLCVSFDLGFGLKA
jgi:hypothetical protein